MRIRDRAAGLTRFELEGFKNPGGFTKYSGYLVVQQKRPGANYLDRDKLLTHVSIYWFTGTGGSAANWYFEAAQTRSGYREVENATPTGVPVFRWDYRSAQKFAKRTNNIV